MAGVYEPGSCDESEEDSASKKTTPPWSNPPSPEAFEHGIAPAERGRGRGGGRAMDNRADLPSEDEEDVHLAQRQAARQRHEEEEEDDDDDDDDEQVTRDARAKRVVYEIKLFKGPSCLLLTTLLLQIVALLSLFAPTSMCCIPLASSSKNESGFLITTRKNSINSSPCSALSLRLCRGRPHINLPVRNRSTMSRTVLSFGPDGAKCSAMSSHVCPSLQYFAMIIVTT